MPVCFGHIILGAVPDVVIVTSIVEVGVTVILHASSPAPEGALLNTSSVAVLISATEGFVLYVQSDIVAASKQVGFPKELTAGIDEADPVLLAKPHTETTA